jgi:MoaD family protein
VIINFYATFRPIVGGKTVQVDLPDGSTINDVLDSLFERFPALKAEVLDEQGNLAPAFHFFVNGRDVHHLTEYRKTPLSSQDKLDVFPPVGGG